MHLRVCLPCASCLRCRLQNMHANPALKAKASTEHIVSRLSELITFDISHQPTRVRARTRGKTAPLIVPQLEMEAPSLLMATELRLGLPGTDDQKPQKTTTASPPATPRGKKRTIDAFEDTTAAEEADKSDDVEVAPPVTKAQVVGWPPVRPSYRAAAIKSKPKKQEDACSNNTTPSPAPAAASTNGGGSFVKVSMDGAPYLRKVDVRMYKGYRELREALEAMFVCFSGADASNGANPSEYAITYEDKDGDLMLVGDVPFDMFSGTCKKLRIIKRSEATGLGSK